MQPQITIQRWPRRIFALLLTLPLASAAQAASSAPFAAPSGFTAPGAGLGVVRLVLALALVLAAVYAAAALMRRLRLIGASGSAELQVISQVALGARERAVLLRAGSQQLLVGVAPGNVRLLCTLPDTTPDPSATVTDGTVVKPGGAAPAMPNFRELLRRSLGR